MTNQEEMSPVIDATAAARAEIATLRAARGGPVMFVQSGGCCSGSVPMCFDEGTLLIGPGDLLLGEIEGCLKNPGRTPARGVQQLKSRSTD